jgi:hypothetical protein
MEEKIIKGIKYRLDKETLTAEVIQKKGYSGDIVIPETVVSNKVSYKVTAIGHSTFFNCKSLTSISIPDSVTTIGDSVFEWCESLTSINISKSVINIGKEIFRYCKSLTTIVVDENNQVYDSRDNCNAIIHTATNTLIFGCCKTNIPNSVTNIGNSAFESCPSLTAITIPDSVTSIGDFAFSFCDSLASVIIPNSVVNIGEGAFRCCESLTTINIPDSVTNIRRLAFSFCKSLSSITIPNGVTTIEENAFEDCESLTSITIPASVTNIDLCAFLNCPSLTSIIVDENNKVYDSRENCNAIIHTETDTLIAGCQNTIIPQSVINIGTCAFGKCSTLTTISIPDSVENIAEYAFYKCKSLSEINIPYSVTTIGSSAFEDCESLTSISISDVPVEDEELYNQADNFFDNLGIGENLSLKINSSFARCSSLTSVLISKHTTNIGNMTFDGCESLIDIRYTGTIEQWQEIKLGTCWNRDVPTKIVHCTNGDVEVEIEV